MSEWKARRFWTMATTRPAEAGPGFEVLLDERVLHTPAKRALILPTQALADAVAAEWQAQGELIVPQTMPLTRAANSAVEKVAPQFDAVAFMIAEYGGTDLLSYRAAEPAILVARQDADWTPMLDWAARALDAPLRVTQGVIPVAQDPRVLARLHARVAGLDLWGLTALHDLVTIPGSLILGLAVIEGRIDADTAHRLARLDEAFQAERWGHDAEAEIATEERRVAMGWAERLWHLTRQG